MKATNEILTQVKDDLQSDLPALFIAAGLTDLTVYATSGSRDARVNGVFVYHNNTNYQYDRSVCAIIIQLQLNSIDGLEAAKYADVVSEYMIKYSPARVGATMIDNVSVDTWPPDNNKTSFVYIDVNFVEPLDSCDGQF